MYYVWVMMDTFSGTGISVSPHDMGFKVELEPKYMRFPIQWNFVDR